jgi:porin
MIRLPIAAIALALAAPAAAQEDGSAPDGPPPALDLAAVYTVDVGATLSGGVDRRVRALDNLDLVADADLDRLIGWRGATAHVYVLNNLGARPNDGAGTLQGVDNIEVGRARLRLFEAWIEQDFGGVRALAGLYDLNSEFYANDAAGLLIAPPFGIGSEVAATGPNGPSIFPSTALAIRLRADVGGGYVQAAVLNAKASTLGDHGGVDTRFRDGVLTIAEVGGGDRLHLAAGGWTYSKRQDDLFALDGAGDPVRRRAYGLYGLAEWRLDERDAAATTLFLRAGFSDGRTTPFSGGFQAGVLIDRPFAARPEGQFSLGVHSAWLSRPFRAAARADGERPARRESAVEVTYADRLTRFLTVQPDLQYVINPGGLRSAREALVGTIRITIEI